MMDDIGLVSAGTWPVVSVQVLPNIGRLDIPIKHRHKIEENSAYLSPHGHKILIRGIMDDTGLVCVSWEVSTRSPVISVQVAAWVGQAR